MERKDSWLIINKVLPDKTKYRCCFCTIGPSALICSALICILSSAIALYSSKVWILDLATLFIPQYVVIQLIFLISLIYGFKKVTSVNRAILIFLTIGGLAINFKQIAPFYTENLTRTASATFPKKMSGTSVKNLSITILNLWSINPYPQRAINYLKRRNSDIIILIEVNKKWNTHLQKLSSYEHKIIDEREGNFGMAVFSKLEILSKTIHKVTKKQIPLIECNLKLSPSTTINLIAAHPTPPKHLTYFKLRTKYLKFLTHLIKKRTKVNPNYKSNLVVAGDLNTTPWSPYFKEILSNNDLVDSATSIKGGGVIFTWPAVMPLLLVPFDHCLTSKDIVIKERTQGPFVWSDHYPLEITLGTN